MTRLDTVLNRIDQDLDRSLERLFAFLRIPSISTDPAYQEACQKAAEHLSRDLATIGFEVGIRPTPGHPVVIANGQGVGPRVLFYGHYDVQPVDPLNLWATPRCRTGARRSSRGEPAMTKAS
jgi:acetylornithine deacetylase/succinyl-diaminopimelate desuccinylase-like protein